MTQDTMMLIRYVGIFLGAYLYGADNELVEPFAGAFLAISLAGWGIWSRFLGPWLREKLRKE